MHLFAIRFVTGQLTATV